MNDEELYSEGCGPPYAARSTKEHGEPTRTGGLVTVASAPKAGANPRARDSARGFLSRLLAPRPLPGPIMVATFKDTPRRDRPAFLDAARRHPGVEVA